MVYPERYLEAVAILLEHEGGFSNDPNDPGGETNFGLTEKFLADNHLFAEADDIENITKDEAISIYYTYVWLRYNYDGIQDNLLMQKVFDISVDIGFYTANKLIQNSVNEINPHTLKVDGILGLKSLSAINDLNPKDLLADFKLEALGHYKELVIANINLKRYLNGWISRVTS